MHHTFLTKALDKARTRLGFCAPNPAVGAVLVNNGNLVGEGVHYAAGSAHAEVEAIVQAGEVAKGATLYVTLEPCCHVGKTGPCVARIIEAGISEVYYGYEDPNPKVQGAGAKALQAAGVTCVHLSQPEIAAFYAPYAHWQRTGMPWVTAKIAMTLNGKIAGPKGVRRQITGELLNEFTQQQRYHADAILTSINTILEDDPILNARVNDIPTPKPIFVLDSQARLPLEAKVCDTAVRLVLFHGRGVSSERIKELKTRGIQSIDCPEGANGLALEACLEHIGAAGYHHVWIEVGQRALQHFLKAKLLKQLYMYVSPQWYAEDCLSALACPFDFSTASSIVWHPMGREIYGEFKWE